MNPLLEIEPLRHEAIQLAAGLKARGLRAGSSAAEREAAEAAEYVLAIADKTARTKPVEWRKLKSRSARVQRWSWKRAEDAWAEACQRLSELNSILDSGTMEKANHKG